MGSRTPRDNESRGPAVTIRHLAGFRVVGNWLFPLLTTGGGRSSEWSSFGAQIQVAWRRPFFDDVGHLPARRRRRERNLCTLCWGKRAAGESSALPRRRLASPPFTLHEHGRGRLGHLLRQPRLRVADVRVRRRLRGLRPAHAALAPAATGLQPTAPPRVNTSGIHGTPCPLHQHCHSHRNSSLCLGWLLRRRRPGRRVPGWPVRHRLRRLRRLRHAPTAATADR
jgi:hypothetical protein